MPEPVRDEPRSAWLVVSLVLLPVLTFGRVLGHGFVNWDDQSQLYQNPDFNPPTLASIARYWTRSHMDLYLPVTYTVWGGIAAVARQETPDPETGATLRASYFHAANLSAHIASTLLVFSILRRVGARDVAAAFGAAVFAVHPLMVEPVAWASALYTVLSGTLSLLAIRFYLEWSIARRDADAARDAVVGAGREGLARAHRWLVAAAVAFLFAMLTKPSAVVVPVVAGVIDWLLVGRPLRRVLVPVALGMLLALPVALVVNRTQGAGFVPDVPLWQRPIVAADAVAFAVGKIAWPAGLAIDYGRSPTRLLGSPQRLWTWVVPAALLAIAWAVRRRAPWALAALGVGVAGAGAYLGLVKFDFQYNSTVADRYLYTSLLGVAIAVAFAADAVTRARPRAVGTAVFVIGGVVVVALAVASAAHARVWRDSRSLFSATLAVNPRSLVAHNVLAYLDTADGNIDRAIAHYRAALRTWPSDEGANYNLGNALLARGEFEQAIAHYKTAAASSPGDAQVRNNLAAALARSGRYAEAAQWYEAALRVDPTLEIAVRGLALARARTAASTTSAAPATTREATSSAP